MSMKYFLLMLFFSSFVKAHEPQKFLQSIQHDEHKAEKIYQSYCANCHNPKPLIPIGAPNIKDKLSWKKRLEQGRKKINQHTLEGVNLMPARGGCFECSDQELIAIVDWMIEQ